MKLSTIDAVKRASQSYGYPLKCEELSSLKGVMLEILSDVMTVCTDENIAVTLGGGTCLGAVRHHGYIPWDDDIDLNIARADVVRFVESFSDRYKDKYWIHFPGVTDGYELDFIRIRKKGTIVRAHDDTVAGESGAYIELFIIENAPNNALFRALHGFGSLALGFLLSCRRYYLHRDKYLSLLSGNPKGSRAVEIKAKFGRLVSFFSVQKWLNIWDKWNSLCKNDASAYVTVPAGRKHYFGELHRRSVFFPVSTGDFEGMRVPLPRDSDVYLCSLYGPGYMVPPPEMDREKHVVLEFDLGDNVKGKNGNEGGSYE